ncbi:MAG: sulfite exporter TauE/SafE family protein [Chitinophagaceae bacterium]
MIPILLSGLILGFAGSLHCVGMCGPLSLALPTGHLTGAMKLFSLFVYQLGRIVMYAFMGLLFGFVGRGIYIAGFQQWFSISLGIFVLMLATFYFMQESFLHLSFLNRFYAAVSRFIGNIISSNTGTIGFLLLGMANGLLPCGMVYIALAATLSFYKVYQSVGFMAMFGTGTLPAMMLAAYSAQLLNMKIRLIFKKSIPFFITAAGLLMILRGMNAGALFNNLHLPQSIRSVISCQH